MVNVVDERADSAYYLAGGLESLVRPDSQGTTGLQRKFGPDGGTALIRIS